MDDSGVNKKRVYCFFSCCQQLAISVHAHFSSEKELGLNIIGLNRVQERVAVALGIGRTSVNKLLTGEKLPKPGESMTRAGEMGITEEDVWRIRPAFLSLLQKKKHITLTKLHKELQSSNQSSWLWGRTTLWKIMRKMVLNFVRQKGYYARVRENPENIALRGEYLTRLEEYKAQSRQIVSMDESWINKNISPRTNSVIIFRLVSSTTTQTHDIHQTQI